MLQGLWIPSEITVIDFAHSEIHKGNAFISDSVDTDMNEGDTLILAFKTMSAPTRVHMIVNFAAYTGGHVDVLEGPTWDNQSGILNPIFNRKRDVSMNSSGLLEDSGQAAFTATDNVILTPTSIAGGTTIHDLWGFGKKDKITSVGRDTNEIILKPDTQYAIKLTADNNTNKGHLILNWYEYNG